MVQAPRKTSVSFGVFTELTVAGETVNLILEQIQDRNIKVLRGGMVAGQRLLVIALLEELIDDLDAPESLRNLAITRLAVELRPDTGSYLFEAAIENAWQITLDSGPTFAIDSLFLSLQSTRARAQPGSLPPSRSPNPNTSAPPGFVSQQQALEFRGAFRLFDAPFTVGVKRRTSEDRSNPAQIRSTSQWVFDASAEGVELPKILTAFGFDAEDLRYGLKELTLSLRFHLDDTRSRVGTQLTRQSSYSFQGEVFWDTGINLADGETLQIEAAIDISKSSITGQTGGQSTLRGLIRGTVSASIPFFETLKLSVMYAFTSVTTTTPNPATSQLATRPNQVPARRTSELIFQLQISSLVLTAVYVSNANQRLLRFTVGLVSGENPTVGDLVAYIVSLYDPSLEGFELDPPWDTFANQPIALDKFAVEVDLERKTVAIAYRETLNVLIAKVSNIGLSYQFGTDTSSTSTATPSRNPARTASNKKVAIALNLSIPGQPTQRVAWDPVNENPPAVPGTNAPIFDLQFLALGQRVAFAPEIVQQARTVEQFMNTMRQTMVPLPPIKRRENPLVAIQQALPPNIVSTDPSQPIRFTGEPIRFSAESGWLIAAQFSLLGTFELSVIFNDPFIYGVRIVLDGPLAQSFSGLEFEILYRRISDTVGVYHTELTLPDAMRYLEFGAVTITLPVVALDIYTNGDFGIDVGFPWGGNFERSMAVTYLVFMGRGGFYFNKLSAETATSTPNAINGVFDPVLEFGLGLQVGLGRTFRKGPLSAEISILVEGVLQGVIAWFKPTANPDDETLFFRVQGGVAIVGRIYGIADFKVVQVDVEVIARIAVLFAVEVYKPAYLALVATVSVKASVKVAFIRVRFSFSLTVKQEFILGSASPTPWQIEEKSGAAMAATIPVFSGARSPSIGFPPRSRTGAVPLGMPAAGQSWSRSQPISARWQATARTPSGSGSSVAAATVEGRSLVWTSPQLDPLENAPPKSLLNGKLRLDLYFQPAFTKTESGVCGVALLFMENGLLPTQTTPAPPAAGTNDFDLLLKTVFRWVIQVHGSTLGLTLSETEPLTLELLQDAYDRLIYFLDHEPAGALWNPLMAFLAGNFVFDISDRPVTTRDISGTIFPMFPQLDMKLQASKSSGEADTLVTIDFDGAKWSHEQIETLRNYFQSLTPNHNLITDVIPPPSPEVQPVPLSLAQLIFIDYFSLLMRSSLQQAIDYVEDHPSGTHSVENLLGTLNTDDMAGMASRFLLHGLRLPTFDVSDDTITDYTPLYQATGQQFAITLETANDQTRIRPDQLRLENVIPESRSWIRLFDYVNDTPPTAPSAALNYPFPDATRTLIQQLNAISGAALPDNLPQRSAFYDPVQRRYDIREVAYWQNSSAERSLLLELPAGLRTRLQGRTSLPTLTLHYSERDEETGEIQEPAFTEPGIWSTKLKLILRRVNHSQTGEPLPTIYAIESVDEASQRLLNDLLEAGAVPSALHALYLSLDEDDSVSVLTTAAADQVFILKTNLSVESNNPRSAALQDAVPFLRLIQESSTVSSGGYFLQYRRGVEAESEGLPDDLFTDGTTATLTLLARFGTTPASYHTCIDISATHPDRQQLSSSVQVGALPQDPANLSVAIFVESSETIEVLNLPAGNVGFTLLRDAIEPEDDSTAADDLQALYQLLHYSLAADFLDAGVQTGDRLPIGPTEIPNQEGPQDDQWQYEKIIPVYALANGNADDIRLPVVPGDAEGDRPPSPYRVIGQSLALDFCWQDIYGNRLGETAEFTDSFEETLAYFDPILGVNQWPSVGEDYRISRKPGDSPDTATLTLELAFDQAKYVPSPVNPLANALDQITTDRTHYQTIFYQVHDPNLDITVSTSLLPTWSATFSSADDAAFDKSFFTDFVTDVYQYLATLSRLEAYVHQPTVATTLVSLGETFTVSVADLAEANAATQGLQSSSAIAIPVSFRVTGQSLNDIAGRLINPALTGDDRAAALTAKVAQMVQTYQTTANLLADGVEIGESTTPLLNRYTTADDTFETLAIAQLALDEDRRIEAKVRQLAGAIADDPFIADGAVLRAGLHPRDYVVVNCSLEEMAVALLQPSTQQSETLLTEEQDLLRLMGHLVQQNGTAALAAGVAIPDLDYTTQTGDTLATLSDRWLELEENASEAEDAPTPPDVNQRLAALIRDLDGLFAVGQTLRASQAELDAIAAARIPPAEEDEDGTNPPPPPSTDVVSLHLSGEKTLRAIAAAIPGSSGQTETPESLAIANAQTPNLWVPDSAIDGSTVVAGDSLWRIATARVLVENPGAAVLRSNLTVELDALTYAFPTTEPATLLALSQFLNLQTQRHYTVLQSVRTIGNISSLIQSQALANRLEQVIAALRSRTGIFGTEDLILADALLDTAVPANASFDSLIQLALERNSSPEPPPVNPISVDQTTPTRIALQNPSLAFAVGSSVTIPGRVMLPRAALVEGPSLKRVAGQPTLTGVAAALGQGISPEAVAIANQSREGLLRTGATVPASVVQQVLHTSLGNETAQQLIDLLPSLALTLREQDTLYSLTAAVNGLMAAAQRWANDQGAALEEALGRLEAIHEQGTVLQQNWLALEATYRQSLGELPGLTQFRDALQRALAGVQTEFFDDSGLKPALNRAVSYGDRPPLDSAAALAAIAAALEAALNGTPFDLNNLLLVLRSSLNTLHEQYETSRLKLAADLFDRRSSQPVGVADAASAIATLPLLASNQFWIKPPAFVQRDIPMPIRANGTLAYPSALVFPVTVEVALHRPAALVHDDAIASARTMTAFFSPKTLDLQPGATPAGDRTASLQPFATDLQAALPQLQLAVGQERSPLGNLDGNIQQGSNAIWAVRLGETGITYNIRETVFPFFFSVAPLSTTLMSSTVSLYGYSAEDGLQLSDSGQPLFTESIRVEAADLNGLGRKYLEAIEAVLKPELAVPAADHADLQGFLQRILQVKARLADVIPQNLAPVLESTLDRPQLDRYRQIALDALEREFQVNLADAYDIETIVQYEVDVAIAPGTTWGEGLAGTPAPRLSGQPVILGARKGDDAYTDFQLLDFALSPARLPLDPNGLGTPPSGSPGLSQLTFFFNTQTPQRYEGISLNLAYRVNELEYTPSTSGSTANPSSAWLNFILPLAEEPNAMGEVQIPIPLRDYPIPPSLIAHQAVSSLGRFPYRLGRQVLTQIVGLLQADLERLNRAIATLQAEIATLRGDGSTVTPEIQAEIDVRQAQVEVQQLEANALQARIDGVTALWGDLEVLEWTSQASLEQDFEAILGTELFQDYGATLLALVVKTQFRQQLETAGVTPELIDQALSLLDDLAESAPSVNAAIQRVIQEELPPDLRQRFEQAVRAIERQTLAHIRNWDYTVLYEHPDVAQDTVECWLDYNTSLNTPELTVDDVMVNEADGIATFRVRLSAPALTTVTVDYRTEDGTAIAPEDYTGIQGTLQFLPGELEKTISVTIVSDTITEGSEAFSLRLSNAANATLADAVGVGTIIDVPLLDTLVRFQHLYPVIAPELQKLEAIGNDPPEPSIRHALTAFTLLAEEVAEAWAQWNPLAQRSGDRTDGYYDINEEYLDAAETEKKATIDAIDIPQPQPLEMALPGFVQASPAPEPDRPTQQTFLFQQSVTGTATETFGESDIPDRRLTAPTLDLLTVQNAWGTVRLSRNKTLHPERPTNPAFIFQTPLVRFKNPITPYIVSDRRWDIASLAPPDAPPEESLHVHIARLFNALLPPDIPQPYDILLTCQYAFALVLGREGVDDDLLAAVPILLTPRFTVREQAAKPAELTDDEFAAMSAMERATWQLRANIVNEIGQWVRDEQPNPANGRFVLSFKLFSNPDTANVTTNPNVPLLQLDHLFLMKSRTPL